MEDLEAKEITYHTLENDLRFGVSLRVDDSGTVDEVNASHERHVLPDFGLAGNGRRLAHLLLPQRVHHRGLADVRVADEANADL